MNKKINKNNRVIIGKNGGFELNLANEEVRRDFVKSIYSFDDKKVIEAMHKLQYKNKLNGKKI